MQITDSIAYDRFWYPAGPAHPDAKADPGHWYDKLHTRHLCTGNIYIMIGKAGEGHFCDGFAGDLLNFRQLYFQLGLIAHFYKASLLKMSDLIAKVIKVRGIGGESTMEQGKSDAEALRRDVQQIYSAFLFFTHRYWFPDLTNQIQGQELFAYWKRHLKLDEMYGQLANELRTINGVIEVRQETELAQQQAELSRLALKLSSGQKQLSEVALVAIPWSIAATVTLGLAGGNGLLDTSKWVDDPLWSALHLSAGAWGIILYAIVGVFTFCLRKRLLDSKLEKSQSK